MAWYKVDDALPTSHKVLSIPRTVRLSSIGLWTLAGAWSAANELDGYVPDFMVTELGGTPRVVTALVKAGLWDEVKGGGYQYRNWGEYQPTRAELEANRAKEAERKRKYREQHGGTSEGTPGVDQGATEPRPSRDRASVTRRSGSGARVAPDNDQHTETPESQGETGHVPPGHHPDGRWDTTRSPDTPSRPVPTRPVDKDKTSSVSPVSDRANALGLTDRGIASIRNAVNLHCDIDATEAEAVELAAHITSKAKTAPRHPGAYVRNAIEAGPSEIDAWFRAARATRKRGTA